jgi:hypothetical protein
MKNKNKKHSYWPTKLTTISLEKYPKRNVKENKLIREKPFGDKDGDGVANYLDCKPLNKKKQDFWMQQTGAWGPLQAAAQQGAR